LRGKDALPIRAPVKLQPPYGKR